MWSPIHYGTHPLHQTFQPITFTSTVHKACRFRRSSSNNGIFHAPENGEKSQTRDFHGQYLAIGGPDRRSPCADGNGEGRTHWVDKWQAGMVPHKTQKDPKKRGAKGGLPRRSPILVLLSPKHASIRSSDGTRCISACMIALVMFLCRSPLKPIISDRCGHVISRFMHQVPPNAS